MQNSTELEQKEAILEETVAEAPAEETPVEEIPVEEAPVEALPGEEAPVEEVPAENTPVAEEAPIEEIPVVALPAENPQKVKKPKKEKKAKKARHSRPWPLKILLDLVAFVLCIAMFLVALAGTLLVDLRIMTTQGGIRQLITQLILPGSLSAGTRYPGLTAAPALPTEDAMTGPLVDWAFELLEEEFGEETPLTKEQVAQFLNESSAKDFLSDKIAGAVDDFYNETSETTITREEIVGLIRDNQQLIKDSFNVEITEEQIRQIEEALTEVEFFDELEEKGFMGVLEDSVAGSLLDNPVADAGKSVLAYIRMATSDTTISYIAGAFIALFLLLWLTNFTLPKTLSDTGIVLLATGLILSIPMMLDNLGLAQTLMEPTILGIIRGMLAAIAPVHFTILGVGAGLILLAIVAKIIKNIRLKKALA